MKKSRRANNKAILTIIILSILILIVIAGIIWALKKTSENNIDAFSGQNSSNDNTTEDANEEKPAMVEVTRDINYELATGSGMIMPTNVQSVFTEGRCQYVDSYIFGQSFFRFIYRTLEEIYKQTKDISDDEITKYYRLHQTQLAEYGVNTEEDYFMLSKSINDVKGTNGDNVVFQSSSIDLSTVTENDDEYSFYITLVYSNNKSMRVKVVVGKTKYKLTYGEDFGFEEAFEKYTGEITKSEVVTFMNTLENTAIPKIKGWAQDKSYNKIRQQYDTRKNTLNSYGFYDTESYLYFAVKVITTRWSKGATLTSETADASSVNNDGTYTSFDVKLNYSTGDVINFKLWIANSKEQDPKFKITCEEN
jgi:hypothetical protein